MKIQVEEWFKTKIKVVTKLTIFNTTENLSELSENY